MVEDTTGPYGGGSKPERARPARVLAGGGARWQEEEGRWGEENFALGGEGLNFHKIEKKKKSTENWILIGKKKYTMNVIFIDKN